MNAPPFPPNPTNGQRFGDWVWSGGSGGRWVCTGGAGTRVIIQKFLTAAPYIPSPGLITAVVECFGGGGPGGWAGPTPSVAWAIAGGGGGSGGYSKSALAAALVLGGVNVTVAQTVGSGTPQGQSTSFGAMVVAHGGFAGSNNDFATGGGAGGHAAPVGVGDIALPGTCGSNGSFEETPPTSTWFAISGGIGGSIFGGATTVNVAPGTASGSQNAIGTTGAGGGGGAVNQVVWANLPPVDIPNGHISGGNGAQGMCIVTEYCWSDTTDEGGCCGDGSMGMARVAIPHHGGWGDGND